jgi:hypothetical protein
MSRGKARYNADRDVAERLKAPAAEPTDIFDAEIRKAIEAFCPAGARPKDMNEMGEASAFVEHIISEARWAQGEVLDLTRKLKKKDMLAEIDDVIATLKPKRGRLKYISDDLYAYLHNDADPRTLADQIGSFISFAETARDRIAQETRLRIRGAEERHRIALEAAVRIFRAAKQHGFRVSATGDASNSKSFSPAVRLMKLLGDRCGLKIKLSTWKNIVGKAKTKAGNL